MKTTSIAKTVCKIRLGTRRNDAAYWRSSPYPERLAALEEIRLEYHRWRQDAESGFQRVYRIVKRR
jgi:hypothetical protein